MDRFDEILEEMKKLHHAKDHDYAGGEYLSNFKLVEKAGVPAWVGTTVRMSDKLARLMAFIKSGEFKVNDEKIQDTLKDMAVYSVITMILYEEYMSKNMSSKQKVEVQTQLDNAKYISNNNNLEAISKLVMNEGRILDLIDGWIKRVGFLETHINSLQHTVGILSRNFARSSKISIAQSVPITKENKRKK